MAQDLARVLGWVQTRRFMRLTQPPFDARRLGRYPSILLSNVGIIVFGFGTAFVNSFHQYLFFRFGVSQALVGHSITSMALSEARLHGRGAWRGVCTGRAGFETIGGAGRGHEPAGPSCHPMAHGAEEAASASGCLERQRMCAQSELSHAGLGVSEGWLQEPPQGP